MNILIFSPYYTPHIGGLECYSDEFSKHITTKENHVVVFTSRIPHSTPEKEEVDHIKIFRFPAFEIISNYPLPKIWLPSFWRIFFEVSENHFDIIISQTRFFFTSFIALLYAKHKKIPLVHVEHGSDFVKLSSPLTNFLAKMYDLVIGRIIFRYSDINISISQAVQGFIQKFDNRESPIIYRGLNFHEIDIINKDDTLQKKYGDKIILATAARLYKWKGIENTIKAIELLPTEMRKKIIFLIIGDGEDFKKLKKLSKNLPIEMFGSIPRESVLRTFKSVDIYIHSSLPGGGLSTSLLEAMYCKCAIIATPNEGASEVIQNKKNGILIEQSLPEKIRGAIISMIENNNIESLQEEAHRSVKNSFSWDKSIQKYKEVFQRFDTKSLIKTKE